MKELSAKLATIATSGNYAKRALYIGSLVVLASCIQNAQASPFPAYLEPINSESSSLTADISSSSHSNNINHHNQHHPDIDAPKYYKLNELLYKSRPRISSISDEEDVASGARSPDQTTELRPLGAGAPQADAPASRRRANGNRREDDDESSIDDLIRDMQQRKAIGRQEGDATGVTYAKSPSTRLDAAGGGKMDSGIGGAYDEASIQRKSTNPIDEDLSGLDEASAQLKRQGKF